MTEDERKIALKLVLICFEQHKRDIKIARYQYENGQRVNS